MRRGSPSPRPVAIVWRRDVAGRWTSGQLSANFCQAGCIGLRMPTVCRRATLGRCWEPLARHGRHNLTGICRRPFAACCSTIRRSAPKNLTASVLAPASSQSCACVCGPGRTMQRHRRRSPPGFNAVLSACGMMRCPASVVAGRSQPACHVSTTVADCATVALPVDRALRRSNGIASCHSNTAPFAILISRNRRPSRARGPGASSG